MGALIEFEIQIDRNTKKTFTMSINQTQKYGKNISIFLPQTKEEQKTEQKKEFVGSGTVYWTDGKIENGRDCPEQE